MIGMERVLSNFRIEKIDKSKKSWVDNWHKVIIKDGGEKVVYCVMDKINPGIEIGKKKKEVLENRKMLKEFVKIGVFRGIFRVSDFNGRNVLIKEGDKLVSIDEGDIGKILDKKNNECARGLSSFTSDEIVKIMGHHSNQIEKLLGYVSKSEVIHKDDMVEI